MVVTSDFGSESLGSSPSGTTNTSSENVHCIVKMVNTIVLKTVDLTGLAGSIPAANCELQFSLV